MSEVTWFEATVMATKEMEERMDKLAELFFWGMYFGFEETTQHGDVDINEPFYCCQRATLMEMIGNIEIDSELLVKKILQKAEKLQYYGKYGVYGGREGIFFCYPQTRGVLDKVQDVPIPDLKASFSEIQKP